MRDIKSHRMYLQRELQVANDNNDLGRASMLDQEIHDIEDEMRRSIGLGRSRKQGNNENMRRAISNAIYRTLRNIEKYNVELYEHLRADLKIGMHLSYRPHQEIFWVT